MSGATVWATLSERAAARPDGLAAVDVDGRPWTAQQLWRAATSAAAQLFDAGVSAGATVAWQAPNSFDALALALGLARLGAVQVPLVTVLGRRDVELVCRQVHPDVFVAASTWRGTDLRAVAVDALAAVGSGRVLPLADLQLRSSMAVLPSTASPDDDRRAQWVFSTSGTTAEPKCARHTNVTVQAAARSYAWGVRLVAADRVSLCFPFAHVGGIVHLVAALAAGATVVLGDGLDPAETVPHLRASGATILPGSPPFVATFLEHDDGRGSPSPLFPAARLMAHGGSPKPAGLVATVRTRFGLDLVSGYGLTEFPMASWNRPADSQEALARTEGHPAPGVEVCITDPDGQVVPAGEEGEIRLRGPQRMAGYVDVSRDGDTLDDDGRVRTGDLGYLDPDGRVVVTGRCKDVIVRNMENVSAREVEVLLEEVPAIAEVAVVGVPDQRTGERVCAVVVPRDPRFPPGLSEVTAALLERGLSRRKLPEQLVVVDALPRNAMGKVLKQQLRTMLGRAGTRGS